MIKKFTLLLLAMLCIAGTSKADVEWPIWEGSNTNNVYIPKDLVATMEVGDKIIVSFTQTDDGKDGEILIGWNTIVYSGMGSGYSSYFDYTNNVVTIAVTETLKNQVAGTASYTQYYWDSEWKSKETTAAGDLRLRANGSLNFSNIVLKKNKSFIVKSYDVSATIGNWSGGTDVSPTGLTSDDYLYFNATIDTEQKDWQAQLGDLGTIGVVGGFWFPVTTYYSSLNGNGAYLNGNYINVSGMKQYHPVSSFSIGSIGYATFSAAQQVTAPNTVTAYKGTISDDKLVLTPFTNNVIPANTGAIIAGDQGAVLEFTASSAETSETSDLIANTSEKDVTSLESGYDYYVLYSGTDESETNLELSTLLSEINDWGGKVTVSTSEPYTAEWTNNSTSSSMGKWLGLDWSSYDILRLVFTSNTVTENVYFGLSYYGQSDSENTGANLATDKLTVDIPLNENYKGAIGNFSFSSNATSGSLTFESAALIDSDGATVPEFRKLNTTSGTLAANKAYLKIPQGSITSAPALRVVFGGGTTAIDKVTTEQKAYPEGIFNIYGQRVNQPGKGIYIVNGKKMIFK